MDDSLDRPRTDHRELNRALKVFTTDPLVGSGLPLWLPAGSVIRQELEALAAEIARGDGCVGVYTSVLAKRALFETSGHWAKFSEDMFPPMKVGGEDFVLRPANCPHHAMVYASEPRSYRELPIRLNELGAMFRAERSGVLSGLTRVRQISLDDTHVFCRPDQVEGEVDRALRSALGAQAVLGLPVDYVRLSRRDASDKYLGSDVQWQEAEEALRSAGHAVLSAHEGLSLVEAEGEAAFYGPKLDLQVRDGRGQEETIATVQLDFSQPERFDLSYVAEDGADHRVVMIHRGTVGSMERVVAALMERYQGRLPMWLAPVQIAVLPVGPADDPGARALVEQLRSAGLRATFEALGSLGARVRDCRLRRDALLGVVGDTELERDEVQVTDVVSGFRGAVGTSQLINLLVDAHRSRAKAVVWPDHS